MQNRRDFLKLSGVLPLASLPLGMNLHAQDTSYKAPLIISTWNNKKANAMAWKALSKNATLLDAIETGINYTESDTNDMSVGKGGRPDRTGNVTLDACIMDHQGNAGSVCYLKDIEHPISVARKVMEDTPHVMLAGKGAREFALKNGFSKTKLLTSKAKKEFKEWKKEQKYKPKVNSELHDTIGMLGLDKNGALSGGCSTSGLGYKMNGRVGDSPIIGAGLFVDNEYGAAVATGMGELVMKSCGSFLVVELMRQGKTPQEACKQAVERIIKGQNTQEMQVGYLAVDKKGRIGSYCIRPGFVFALRNDTQDIVVQSDSHFD